MQLDALKPGMVGGMHAFGKWYCEPTPNPWSGGCDYKGATNMKELNAILKASLAPFLFPQWPQRIWQS